MYDLIIARIYMIKKSKKIMIQCRNMNKVVQKNSLNLVTYFTQEINSSFDVENVGHEPNVVISSRSRCFTNSYTR